MIVEVPNAGSTAEVSGRSLADRFPALSRLTSGLRRRQIPLVAQLAETDCGAACLAMVLGYWGHRGILG